MHEQFKKEPELIPFSCVKVNIPRKHILKLYVRNGYITRKEAQKISQKLKQIEQAENKLRNVRSLVELVLLKRPKSDSLGL